MHPLQRQHKIPNPVKMNRLSKYSRRDIYSLGSVKRSSDFKHKKSIIRAEETRRIWQGLNRRPKEQACRSQGGCSNHSAIFHMHRMGEKLSLTIVSAKHISHRIHCLNFVLSFFHKRITCLRQLYCIA